MLSLHSKNCLLFLLFFSPILFLSASQSQLSSCEIGNYCDKDMTIACSIYGNCRFNIYDFYNATSTKKSSCVCNRGYATYYGASTEEEGSNGKTSGIFKYCCYKQKDQFKAFLLEFLIGFGAGHFYLGKIKHAVVKLLIQFSLCVFCCCAGFIGCLRKTKLKDFRKKYERVKKDDDSNVFESEEENEENDDEVKINKSFFKCNLYYILIFCAFCVFTFINISDVFLFGYGYYTDGNGVPMKRW